MTAKTVQPISTEAIKEAIVALIKENDADASISRKEIYLFGKKRKKA